MHHMQSGTDFKFMNWQSAARFTGHRDNLRLYVFTSKGRSNLYFLCLNLAIQPEH